MENTERKTPVVYLGLTGDILHPGIINIIQEGVKHGDLMVGLLTDQAIANHKRLPFLTFEQRKQIISAIAGVHEIVPQNEWSYANNIRQYKPNYLIHGDDWKDGIEAPIRTECIEALSEYGGTLIEIPYTKGFSSDGLNARIQQIGTTPDSRRSMLRRLIANKKVVRIMEAHSALCGLIIENEKYVDPTTGETRQFDGMWASSLTDCTVKGKPDIEAVDTTTRINEMTNILECTTKPIIYDADTGGKKEHFAFTVRTLERNGVSAAIIEDKVGLKQNSLFGTAAKQVQDSIPDFCEKIKTGKAAQISQDFMIIARCESLIAGAGVEDAVTRCRAYVKAGADGIMIHSKEKDGKEIFEFLAKFRESDITTPIVLVPTTFNTFTEKELLKYNIAGPLIIIHANHMLRASYPAMKKVAHMILEDTNSKRASDECCMSIKEILHLIPGTAATVKK